MPRRYVHPGVEKVTLPRVLFALSELLRLAMVAKLSGGDDEVVSLELGPELPRSTSTHHTTLLRESSVVFVRGEGRKCMIRLRADDLDGRFPGLIETVLGCCDRDGAPLPGSVR